MGSSRLLLTQLPITLGSLTILSWVMTFWKANKKIYTSSKFHSFPIRFVHVGEVQSLYSSFWVVADPSSLTQAQNPHKCSELSKITTQRSAISQSITLQIFISKSLSKWIQWPKEASALFTPAHLSPTLHTHTNSQSSRKEKVSPPI